MNKKDRLLIDKFIERLKGIEQVEAAVLYGSIARGDYDRRSDIDIMVVIDHEKPISFLSQITRIITGLKPHRDIQCTLTNLKDKDEEFYKNVFKDGEVLFGKFILTPKHISVKPYNLISYDLSGVSPSNKVRITHNIHGHRSVKKVKGKKYQYDYKGLKDKYNVRFINKGVIILPLTDAQDFMRELNKLKVNYQSFNIWM